MMTSYINNEDIGYVDSVDEEDAGDLLQRKTHEKCQHSNHFHGNTWCIIVFVFAFISVMECTCNYFDIKYFM